MTLRTYPEGTSHPGPIGRVVADSEPAWPVAPAPPPGAPNVVAILFDDLGFAQLGCFGGLAGRIRTPHIDRLAGEGLRFRNFHTTALCSPSRAALLTGRNHHSVGVATIMERATGYPGYNGRIPKDAAMLPAVLLEHGYATMALGKWHVAPDEHISPAGPFDRFPLGQGFERFYGFLGGETSQWEPDLWEDNHRVQAPGRPEDGYHLSEDLVDHAIEWIGTLHAVAPSKPFFTYVAFGATHSPHHVPKSYIDEYRGAFDAGWDEIRGETLAQQIEMGLVPEHTDLPGLNPGVRAWADLSDDERRLFARQMEVYAAMVTHTDAQIGRLVDFLDRSGLPTPGDATTVFNGTPDAHFAAALGAGYRMVAELADPQHGLWAVEVASTSGHPGSPHYDDQLQPWNEGSLHYLSLSGECQAATRLTLEP